MDENIKEIIEFINDLQEESSVPRNVKAKLLNITEILKEDSDKSLKVNKALHELDEINDDVNIQSYIRTQIWNIASMLEKL